MASSNRHWPSMFKSKSCTTIHNHWQHYNINSSILSTGYQVQKGTYTPSAAGGEQRSTPEAKPRWNPRPEQIRILESLFNSGMVSPSRDEIRKIRVQLQEYGQVGDANVFYWFQNRKSRSKHKQRQIHHNSKSLPSQQKSRHHRATNSAPPSSSSSHKFSTDSTDNAAFSLTSASPVQNQSFFETQRDLLSDTFFFPAEQEPIFGFSFPEQYSVEDCSSLLLSEFMLMNHDQPLKNSSSSGQTQFNSIQVSNELTDFQSPLLPLNGVDESNRPKMSTVFINGVCFEVEVEPVDLRQIFGYDALLIHSSGIPVLTNERGVTLQPLQDGAFYYLI